ncbi:SCO3933 family regulatory protein [Kineosporia corallincola]|uniref:SCO3933 family regulatory protein n=1 Tax=Kineosporia corallincola TaxID=2835133 RepID=UPI003FD81CE7
MRTIPVDVSAFEAWLCVMLPEPRVANPDTGELRKDRESGQTMYQVGVCAIQGRNSSVIQVTVVGEPQGLTLGAPVKVVDLQATPWDRDGRSGVAWRASALAPLQAPTGGRATAGAPGSPAGSGAAGRGEAR